MMCMPALHFAVRIATGFAAALLLFFCTASPACAESLQVTVVLSENSGAYLEFSDALRENLLKRNITPLVVEQPDGAIPHSGLVVGVGMKAAAAIAASNAPAVLNVLVPKSGHEKLLRDFPRRANSKTYSAIFLDQPIERQIGLIVAALPDWQRVGVMYVTPPGELAQLGREMKNYGLVLHEQAISSAFPLNAALQGLLKESQVLLALPDAEVYNSSTIRNILLTAYRSGVPLIGFSPGYVKAGALCALYTTPGQFAAQSAGLIRKFGYTQTLPAARSPREFEVSVNEQVARSLGLQIKNAARLHEEIQDFERNEP